MLFITPAFALSDLRLPIAGFDTAECYIMIMRGLGARMLSASHSGRMKWINIPEGAEMGALHVCRQTALGDQSAQLLAASNAVSFPSLALTHTHSCCLLRADAQSGPFCPQQRLGVETI